MYIQEAGGGAHWRFASPLCRVAPLRPGQGGSWGSLGPVEVGRPTYRVLPGEGAEDGCSRL